MDPLDSFGKPSFRPTAAAPGRNEVYVEADLPEDDRIYGDIPFIPAQPFDHALPRLGFGGLAQDIGIHKIGRHRESVDSDGTGTK